MPTGGLSASSSGDSESYITRPFNLRVLIASGVLYSQRPRFIRESTNTSMGLNRIETFRPANGKDFLIINLTPVDLRRLSPRKIKILLVRSEYELAYNTLTECANAMRAVYLITGQPGIGG
jgi:hypothetical protein